MGSRGILYGILHIFFRGAVVYAFVDEWFKMTLKTVMVLCLIVLFYVNLQSSLYTRKALEAEIAGIINGSSLQLLLHSLIFGQSADVFFFFLPHSLLALMCTLLHVVYKISALKNDYLYIFAYMLNTKIYK